MRILIVEVSDSKGEWWRRRESNPGAVLDFKGLFGCFGDCIEAARGTAIDDGAAPSRRLPAHLRVRTRTSGPVARRERFEPGPPGSKPNRGARNGSRIARGSPSGPYRARREDVRGGARSRPAAATDAGARSIHANQSASASRRQAVLGTSDFHRPATDRRRHHCQLTRSCSTWDSDPRPTSWAAGSPPGTSGRNSPC